MKSKELILICLFASMIFLALLIGIPMPIASFLKINIAGLIVLIAWKKIGIKGSMIALIIALILNYLLINSYAGIPIDQMAFFIAAISMLYVYKISKNIAFAVILTTIIMTMLNYFIITPFYLYLSSEIFITYLDMILSLEYIKMILVIYPLFNILQWGLVGILFKIYLKKEYKWIE